MIKGMSAFTWDTSIITVRFRVGPEGQRIITVRFRDGPEGQRTYEFSLLYRASVVFKIIF